VKLVQVTFHFEYTDLIEQILDDHGIAHWMRHSRIEGHDVEGKHMGTQAFPGSVSIVEARVEDDRVEALLDDLRTFRDGKRAHRHVTALVLSVERTL
jgi:hypothetical protein